MCWSASVINFSSAIVRMNLLALPIITVFIREDFLKKKKIIVQKRGLSIRKSDIGLL